MLLDNKRMFISGIGTLYSQTGVYFGQWSGGIQSGFGKSFFNNGNKYEGEYKDGFKHGRGTFTVQVFTYFGLLKELIPILKFQNIQNPLIPASRSQPLSLN